MAFAETLLFSSLCLGSVLAVLFLSNLFSSHRTLGYRYFLGLAILIMLSDQTLSYLAVSGQVKFPFLFRITYPFRLSVSPLIYLYICSLSRPQMSWRDVNPIHAVPFAIGAVWYLVSLLWGGQELFHMGSAYHLDRYLRVVASAVLFFPYLFLIRRELKNLQADIKEQSSVDLRLPWTQMIVYVYYWMALLLLLDLFSPPTSQTWVFRSLSSTIMLTCLTYLGLKHSKAFQVEVKPAQEPALNARELADLGARLMAELKDKQMYLNPTLRLSDLASAMGVRSYLVTEVLKRGLGTTFYDLVNGLRVEHARFLIGSTDKQHLNLLGIATESGFNSKSTFNEAFKRTVGMTPSEYRRTLQPAARLEFRAEQ